MKKMPLLPIAGIILLISLFSCGKENNPIPTPVKPSTGTLLIYTTDTSIFRICGPSILVTLNTGQTSFIYNGYESPPGNCTDRFGGTFTLPAGDYTYTATTIACDTIRGVASVDSGLCSIVRIR